MVEKDSYKMICEKTVDPEVIKLYCTTDIEYQGFNHKFYNGWIKNLSILK